MRRAPQLPDVGLDWLMPRCNVIDGGCLEWRLRAVAGRYPVVRVQGQEWYVRRLLWQLTHGRPPRKGLDVVVSCGNPLCVCPDCLCESRPAARTRGRPKSLQHRIKTALAMRRRSELTPEMVAEIRSSELSGPAMDKRLGLFAGHSQQVRSGRVWNELVSPFAGLQWLPVADKR